MATGLLYKAVSEKENMSNLALEKKLGLGNGVIGKAIKRNSAIKPLVLAKIANAFPHLDLKQMEIGLIGGDDSANKGGVNTEVPKDKKFSKPAPTAEHSVKPDQMNGQALGIEYMKLLQQATTSAIQEIAKVAQQSIQSIKQTSDDSRTTSKEMLYELMQTMEKQAKHDQVTQITLEEIGRKAEATYKMLVGLRQFSIDEFATLSDRTQNEVEEILSKTVGEEVDILKTGNHVGRIHRKKKVGT